MNTRRGFISSLAGVVAWAKSPKIKSISPAASAIHPTCETKPCIACLAAIPVNAVKCGPCGEWQCDPYRYEVRFMTRDGRTVEPSPIFRGSDLDQLKNTIMIAGIIPSDAVGRTIMISKRGE